MKNLLNFFNPQYQDKQIKKRMHGLDTLRALAILLVFMFHYPRDSHEHSIFGAFGNFGWVGVDLFFVLSGYLIGNQIFASLIKNNTFSLKSFWYRRLLRTLPNYWLVLVLYFLIPGFREWHQPMSASFWEFLTFTQNLGLHRGAYSHAWSLCVEEQFYLVLPLLALWVFYKGSVRSAWISIALILILETALRAWLWIHDVQSMPIATRYLSYMPDLYYPTDTRLYGLIFGVSIAMIKNFHPSLWEKITHKGPLFFLLGLMGSLASFYIYRDFFTMFDFSTTVFIYPLLNLSFAFLVLAALSPRTYLSQLKIPGATLIATWSYAMYLIQKQMIFLSTEALGHFDISQTSLATVLVSLFFTLLASWLMYTLIETPFLKLRDKRFLV